MCITSTKFEIDCDFSGLISVVLLSDFPRLSVSVPEELSSYGHSRTPSYTSQLSKLSGANTVILSLSRFKDDATDYYKSIQITNLLLTIFLGYSSNHSSSVELSHRRNGSGGSASTGIGSIEPNDQLGERDEKESRPTFTATCHHSCENPSTPNKVHR